MSHLVEVPIKNPGSLMKLRATAIANAEDNYFIDCILISKTEAEFANANRSLKLYLTHWQFNRRRLVANAYRQLDIAASKSKNETINTADCAIQSYEMLPSSSSSLGNKYRLRD